MGSVAIDFDHLLQLLDPGRVGQDTPRPAAHTLVTPLTLAVLGRRRAEPAASLLEGAAGGTAVHLARDLVTGSGVALLAPLVRRRVRLPYAVYAVMLAAGAGARHWRRRR